MSINHGIRSYTDAELKAVHHRCLHRGLDGTTAAIEREMMRRSEEDRSSELLLVIPAPSQASFAL